MESQTRSSVGATWNEYAAQLGLSSIGVDSYNDVAPPELKNGTAPIQWPLQFSRSGPKSEKHYPEAH
jgi:hypothetical protein